MPDLLKRGDVHFVEMVAVRQDMEFQVGPGLWFGSEPLLWHTSGHDS
ncbi:hypothetical protein ACVINI_006462 [Rhizobium beringeri]